MLLMNAPCSCIPCALIAEMSAEIVTVRPVSSYPSPGDESVLVTVTTIGTVTVSMNAARSVLETVDEAATATVSVNAATSVLDTEATMLTVLPVSSNDVPVNTSVLETVATIGTVTFSTWV